MDSFINGLYDELGKLDDTVKKLSNDTAPSYCRQFCTSRTVEKGISCEFKVFATVVPDFI